ncbi:MAG: hypothetical protein JJU45_02630 [Acidimicrobiia bacterium]|nr:hypothetical protein [Acidimicrobiia bacterium]
MANAAVESFNSTLEWELLSRRMFDAKEQARREVAAFLATRATEEATLHEAA